MWNLWMFIVASVFPQIITSQLTNTVTQPTHITPIPAMSRVLTPALNAGNVPPPANNKQLWKLRLNPSTQENNVVNVVDHIGPFPYRNSMADGAPPGHPPHPYTYHNNNNNRQSEYSVNEWDIIDDYRAPPTLTLPMTPVVLDPPTQTRYVNPVRSLTELEARRIPSHNTTFAPLVHYHHHAKKPSRARLLPLHCNANPTLTRDKPYQQQGYYDLVSMYYIILACGILFPPIWILLGTGQFDTLLNVPEQPGPKSYTMTSLSDDEKREVRSVSRIKWVAIALSVFIWCCCLVGIVVGLVYRNV